MRSTFIIVLALCFSVAASAAEVWVLRGQTGPNCPASIAVWRADALLYADSGVIGEVHILDVSNGGSARQNEFAVSPGRAVSLDQSALDRADAVVWITHLSIPDGVVVDGRLTYIPDECKGIPAPLEAFTKLQAPVFRSLTPAGVRQIHTGSDLGAQSVRVNVGVYNAGAVSAEATITIRRPNCDVEPLSTVVEVPARTLIQTSLNPPVRCAQGLTYPGSFTVTEVTVSEPSLSYAVSLSNVGAPTATLGFASGPN